MKMIVITMLAALLASAQTNAPSGAKALFFSADTGDETLTSSPNAPAAAKRTPTTHTPKSTEGATAKPVVTGLKYYIELREADGTLQRVSPNRVFHSGDRIRFHVTTNVDGNLVIYQKQEDLPEERLYPPAAIPDATGYVSRGTDITLPSAHSSFRFDNHPGEIHLTLMLTARTKQEDPEADVLHNSEIASAEGAHQAAAAEKGSKALRIEDDPAEDNAQYKVMDSRLDSKIPAGVVATEITLSHAR